MKPNQTFQNYVGNVGGKSVRGLVLVMGDNKK